MDNAWVLYGKLQKPFLIGDTGKTVQVLLPPLPQYPRSSDVSWCSLYACTFYWRNATRTQFSAMKMPLTAFCLAIWTETNVNDSSPHLNVCLQATNMSDRPQWRFKVKCCIGGCSWYHLASGPEKGPINVLWVCGCVYIQLIRVLAYTCISQVLGYTLYVIEGPIGWQS